MPVGGSDSSECAQGSQAALGYDGESGDREEPDEQQSDRGQHENDDLGTGLVGLCSERDAETPARERTERPQTRLAGIDQHGDLRRWVGLAGGDERELVEQVQRVFDQAHHLEAPALFSPDAPDVQIERCRRAVCHRDLVRPGGVAPRVETHRHVHEGAMRVFGPEVDGRDGAGDGNALMGNDVRAAKMPLDGGDFRGEIGIRAGK